MKNCWWKGACPGVKTPDQPDALDGGDGVVGTESAVQNLFNSGGRLVRAEHYGNLREGAFTEWSKAMA